MRLDDGTLKLLDNLASKKKTTKSEIAREAIDSYITKRLSGGAKTLLKMASRAKQRRYEGPADIIENLDKYLYEGVK